MCEISPLLFWNVFSNRLLEQMQSHISCMCVIFSNVRLHKSSHIACFKGCKVTFVTCVIFSNFRLHISSQINCFNRCKVTIVTEVRNFSIIFFKRLLKSPAWTDAKPHYCMCVIFPNVSFHMCSQITCLNMCKVTFVACVRFSQMLDYTCPLKSPA